MLSRTIWTKVLSKDSALRWSSSQAKAAVAFRNFVESLVSDPGTLTPPPPDVGATPLATRKQRNKDGLIQLSQVKRISAEEAVRMLNDGLAGNYAKRVDLANIVSEKANSTTDQQLNVSFSDLTAALAVLIETQNGNSPIAKTLMNECERMLQNENLDTDLNVLIRLISAAKNAYFSLPLQLNAKLFSELNKRISKASSPSQILGILNGYQKLTKESLDSVSMAAKNLMPVMNVAELVSLLNQYAVRAFRDKDCISQIITRLTSFPEPFNLNQSITLLQALTSLSIFDARILRKIITDLSNSDLTTLSSWDQLTTMVNSLSRLRLADQTLWTAMLKWAVKNFEQTQVNQISRLLGGAAHIGFRNEQANELANELAKVLDQTKARKESFWLSSIHSLAFYDALPAPLAETVLNKDFINSLCADASSKPETTMYYLLRLMQINGHVKFCLKDYYGPTFEITGSATSLSATPQIARQLKYGVNSNAETGFLDMFYKVAPLSHCKAPQLHSSGIYIEAEIKPTEKGSTRCLPVTDWANNAADSNTRPILYFPWNLAHYQCDASPITTPSLNQDEARESNLLGFHQMGIRLLRKEGRNPLVILDSELRQHAEMTEMIAYLKKRIAS